MSDVIRLNLMLIAGGFFRFILTVSFIKKIKVGVKNSNNAEIINERLDLVCRVISALDP